MKRPFYRQDDPRRRPRIPLERTPRRRDQQHAAEALLFVLAIVCGGLAFARVLALVWRWVF